LIRHYKKKLPSGIALKLITQNEAGTEADLMTMACNTKSGARPEWVKPKKYRLYSNLPASE
jgi:hypothetical protein